MKKSLKLPAIVLALALLVAPAFAIHEKEIVKETPAQEEKESAEGPITVSFESSLYNRYYGQGFMNHDSLALQNEVAIEVNGFGMSIWQDADLKEGRPYETDLYLYYTLSADVLEVTFGYNWYTVLEGDNSSELFADVSADTLLQPTLSVGIDIDANPGIYAWLGIGHTFEILGTELSPGAAVEFSYNYWVEGMRLSTAVFSLEEAVPVGDYLTITPKVIYNLSLDKDNYENALVYGLTVSVEF